MEKDVEYELLCPKDGTPMVKQEKRGVIIDVCPRDGSVFLDRGELEHIVATLATQPGFSPARVAAYTPPAQHHPVAYGHQPHHVGGHHGGSSSDHRRRGHHRESFDLDDLFED